MKCEGHCEHVDEVFRATFGERDDGGDHAKVTHLYERELRGEWIERLMGPALVAAVTAIIVKVVG